jgi:hypothetical protein
MFLERVSNQFGFSLTEITVAIGLLGGVSLVTMKLMKDTTNNDAYLRYRAAVAQTVSLLETYTSDPQMCKTMLVGKTRTNVLDDSTSPPLFGGTGEITVTTKTGVTKRLLTSNTNYPDFRIASPGIFLLKSVYDSASNPVSAIYIKFQIRDRSKLLFGTSGAKTLVKIIHVRTQLQADGVTIKSCGPLVSEGNLSAKRILCLSLKGAATWDGTECRLNEMKCPSGQVPFQMTSLGSVSCIPVENKVDPSQVFDFSPDTCTPGQSVRLTTGADGKIRADCF